MEFSRNELQRLGAVGDALRSYQAQITLPQVLALIEIGLNPGMSVNDLAEKLSVPQQTVSRHVAILLGRYQTLSENGAVSEDPPVFVRQEISSTDPRKRALFLSEEGLAFLKMLS